MQPINQDEVHLVNQLKRHEGFRSKPYQDSVGVWTCGYGWNMEDTPLPEALAAEMLGLKIQEDRGTIQRAFPWFINLSPMRQNVIINMVYNMGLDGFKTFKQTIVAMEAGNADLAAERMLNSLWARQVGPRAIELSRQYRQG